MAVMVTTGHPHTPVMVFEEADGYALDPMGNPYVDVLKGSERIATFVRYESVAIVNGLDAQSFTRHVHELRGGIAVDPIFQAPKHKLGLRDCGCSPECLAKRPRPSSDG